MLNYEFAYIQGEETCRIFYILINYRFSEWDKLQICYIIVVQNYCKEIAFSYDITIFKIHAQANLAIQVYTKIEVLCLATTCGSAQYQEYP